MRVEEGLPLLLAAHSATCLTMIWGLSYNTDVCPRHELSCVLSSDGKALSVWVEPFDWWMQTLAVENFFYNLKKQLHLLLSARVAWLKPGKMDLRLRLWLWKPMGDMFLLSMFFSDWISSLTDILVSAFYTIGVSRVKAFCTIEAASTLAWKIPWMEEPGRLQSMGSLRVRHDWATSLSLFTFMHWRRKWQPTPVFLPGESQGRESLVGCRLWGRTESDTTEVTQQQQSHLTPGCGVLACRDEVVWGQGWCGGRRKSDRWLCCQLSKREEEEGSTGGRPGLSKHHLGTWSSLATGRANSWLKIQITRSQGESRTHTTLWLVWNPDEETRKGK